MARFKDPQAELGTVKGEPPAQREQRQQRDRQRVRRAAIEERAEMILEHDDNVTTMAGARRQAARELIENKEFEAAVRKGHIDPGTGELTRAGRKAQRQRPKQERQQQRPKSGAGRPRASRRATGDRLVRRTARTVVAPFGSAASAGWTLFQGGLSLVLLYVVLREAGAVGDLTDGITSGLRRFADPYTPLLPSRGEASPPPPSTRRSGAPVVTTPRNRGGRA